MEDDPEITRHRETAGHSIQMLRAVVDGATYEAVALQFGISRTAVERRIKSIAVQLTQEVGVNGLKEEGAAFVRRLRLRRDAILVALDQFTPVAPSGERPARVLSEAEVPDTGDRHHPGCPSFEPEAGQSGLGELVGQAVIEVEPGRVELRVDFPWERMTGRSVARGEPAEPAEVAQPRRRMSLRALMHFLFERAGFNRWSPAMEGKRNQGVLHKYLTEAAEDVRVKGTALGERLYVPEPFSEQRKADAAQRRRAKLGILRPHDGHWPMAVVVGEFKACDDTALGRRIWIRHMPDVPLLASSRLWERTERVFGPLFEARDADTGDGVHLMVAALIRARREQTYEVESLTLMLTSEHWIPVEGVHELPLIQALVAQQRRFVKPLRYDAKSVSEFANALLLDAGPTAVPLHLLSPFMNPAERIAKERAIVGRGAVPWVWRTEDVMPPLPETAAVHPV